MTKYRQLVKEYADSIAKIKVQQAEYETLVAKADAIKVDLHPEPDWQAIDRVEESVEEAMGTYDDLMCLWSELSQDIEVEYQNVPFADPRNAGIAGFYREAELTYAG